MEQVKQEEEQAEQEVPLRPWLPSLIQAKQIEGDDGQEIQKESEQEVQIPDTKG